MKLTKKNNAGVESAERNVEQVFLDSGGIPPQCRWGFSGGGVGDVGDSVLLCGGGGGAASAGLYESTLGECQEGSGGGIRGSKQHSVDLLLQTFLVIAHSEFHLLEAIRRKFLVCLHNSNAHEHTHTRALGMETRYAGAA